MSVHERWLRSVKRCPNFQPSTLNQTQIRVSLLPIGNILPYFIQRGWKTRQKILQIGRGGGVWKRLPHPKYFFFLSDLNMIFYNDKKSFKSEGGEFKEHCPPPKWNIENMNKIFLFLSDWNMIFYSFDNFGGPKKSLFGWIYQDKIILQIGGGGG